MSWHLPTLDDLMAQLGAGQVVQVKCPSCRRTVPGDMLRDFRAHGLGFVCDACDARLLREGRLDPIQRLEGLGAPPELVDKARAKQARGEPPL